MRGVELLTHLGRRVRVGFVAWVGLALSVVTLAVLAFGVGSAQADSVLGQVPGYGLFSVGCASGSTLNCVVVGEGLIENDSVVSAVVPIDNGVVGAAKRSPAGFLAQAVACTSATTCLADGSMGGEGAVVPITNGVFGAVQQVAGTTDLFGIECQASTCLAVGLQENVGSSTGVVVPITGTTAEAAEQVPGTDKLYGVACESPGACVAVGAEETSTVTTTGCQPGQTCLSNSDQAVSVAIANGVPGAPQPVQSSAYLTLLQAVACPTATECVAVGYADPSVSASGVGVVVPIADGTNGAAQEVPGISDFHGVGCQTTTSCFAGGGGAHDGVLLPITSGGTLGAAQTEPGTQVVEGFACADAANCVAVGYEQDQTMPGGGTGTVFAIGTPSPSASPSAALSSSLAVGGAAARISAVLKHGGFAAPGSAAAPGTVTITWYSVPAGAHLARATKPIMIAQGSHTFSTAGKASIKVRLTSRGRALLKRSKRVKLTAVGTFAPTHGTKSSKQKSFTLK
jgi:hypothetical protein